MMKDINKEHFNTEVGDAFTLYSEYLGCRRHKKSSHLNHGSQVIQNCWNFGLSGGSVNLQPNKQSIGVTTLVKYINSSNKAANQALEKKKKIIQKAKCTCSKKKKRIKYISS